MFTIPCTWITYCSTAYESVWNNTDVTVNGKKTYNRFHPDQLSWVLLVAHLIPCSPLTCPEWQLPVSPAKPGWSHTSIIH